ncbi:MAG: hypothetical protein KGJ23_05970 [Euryarchaeota archaeon]|nr:hypothetical protein [Euryarchaeota archaeon]MDE1836145.1 hypothetical protein [Euryarchaeota archaeon]MDE1879435.1 hypothetical protein [Euryarchaeota archaeon]MDE2044123.1 hypothetical protein [Thermoplasmata archaeon]
MGYPKSPRELKGKEARMFLQKMRAFKVSAKNRAFYRDAEAFYLKTQPKSRKA